MTPERFDISVAEGEFLEWAWVHGKNRYGTLRRSVLESLAAGVCLVGAIDVQGVRSVRAAAGTDPVLRAALTTVFVAPESIEELMTRLSGRGDAPADIERRMQTAVAEFREAAAYDHRIVSTTRDADFAELHAIWKLAVCRR
jgi:guanylate kinase